MILLITVLVWALVLGLSPGLTIIAVSVTVLVMDAIGPGVIDRLLRHASDPADPNDHGINLEETR